MILNEDHYIPPKRLFYQIFEGIMNGSIPDLAPIHKAFFGKTNALVEYAVTSKKAAAFSTLYIATMANAGYVWKKRLLSDFSRKFIIANLETEEPLKTDNLLYHTAEIVCSFNSLYSPGIRDDGSTLRSEHLKVLDRLDALPELENVEIKLCKNSRDNIFEWEDFIHTQKLLERPMEGCGNYIAQTTKAALLKQRSKRVLQP